MASTEQRQFRALYRLSLARLIDLEIIASRGDLYGLFARFAGVLLALSMALMGMIVSPYVHHKLTATRIATHVWNDQEFLISITLAVAGLFSVLAWNNVLPDRRDSLVLGTLPVRTRTAAFARLAAIATCIVSIVVTANLFIALTFPYVTTHTPGEALRAAVAWWIMALAAGIFAFAWTLAVQGVAALLLRWHPFLRVSAVLQLSSLFVVLLLFFLTPPFAQTVHERPDLAAFLPSYWFAALLEVLKGNRDPALVGLAAVAVRNFAVVVAVAGAAFALSWFRLTRTIVEAPDIASRSGQTLAARCGNLLVKTFFPRPLDRAIMLFTARTAVRSRQHRLLLAAYGGIGFALAATFSKGFLGVSGWHWDRPNVPLLVVGMLLLISAVMATRTIFALPHSLPSNWIFRVTAVQSPALYFDAVRKSLITLAALPAWVVCCVACLAVWPGRYSVEASVVLVLLGLILVDYSLYQFRKLPFACSWLPASGQSLSTVRAMAFGFGFLTFASALGGIELWSIRSVGRFVVLCSVLGVWAIWLRRRGREFAASPGNSVQFDDQPKAEIFALDLRPDGEWSSEQAWVDAIDTRAERSWRGRLRAIALILLIALGGGLVYEQASEWRDMQAYPQIGQSVNIGGRSLNYYCEGQGSPTVVMDTGSGSPGYSWLPVQRGIATFTRACWYDRAGYGWSDPAKDSRTSADIAEDLFRMLHTAGIPPPYVLVGHSFGGFNVRIFASRHRDETAGLVLVDSSSEYDDDIQLPDSVKSPVVRYVPRPLWRPLAAVNSFLVHEGVARLLDDGPPPPPRRFSAPEVAMLHALRLQAKTFDMSGVEGLSRGESAKQVKAVRNLGDMPLLVLTAGRRFTFPGDEEEARRVEAYYRYHVYEDQPRLLRLSTHSRQVIVENGHGIPFENPDAVTTAVREVIADLRCTL